MFEVGNTYVFNGDSVTPCFELEGHSGVREYANEVFLMRVGAHDIEYRQGVIRPAYKEKCKCITGCPLTFELSHIESPILEDSIRYKQAEVVRKVLSELGCPTSDMDVYAIMEVAIPWTLREQSVTEDQVISALYGYLKRVTTEKYHGSTNGHKSYKDTMSGVFTVIFGHKVAYTIMQLVDTGNISVNYFDDKFTAYYCDMKIEDFISSVEGMVGKSIGSGQASTTLSDGAFMNAVNKMGL